MGGADLENTAGFFSGSTGWHNFSHLQSIPDQDEQRNVGGEDLRRTVQKSQFSSRDVAEGNEEMHGQGRFLGNRRGKKKKGLKEAAVPSLTRRGRTCIVFSLTKLMGRSK